MEDGGDDVRQMPRRVVRNLHAVPQLQLVAD
jgi:hypothetical protein